jgi:glutaredoxin-like YruB-family protein
MKNSIFCIVLLFSLLLSLPLPSRAVPYKSPPKVEIYVTSWCPYCRALEKFLKAQNVNYTKYDIEKDSQGMKQHARLGGGGVPVTVINSKQVIRGFEPSELYRALDLGR